MPNPQLGPQHDLAIRLGSIERQLKALLTMPTAQALSAYQSDGSIGWQSYLDPTAGATTTVWRQGPSTPGAVQTNGQWPAFMVIGQLQSGGVPQGNGLISYRPDMSVSMTVGNKGVGLIDKNGAILFSESETTFGGIKTPALSYAGGANTNVATWPATNATAWTTIWSAVLPINQPQLGYSLTGYAPAGVTGNFRITVGGTTVTSWSAVGTFSNNVGQANIPSGVSFGGAPVINLDAQVASGSGTVSAVAYGVWGTATS